MRITESARNALERSDTLRNVYNIAGRLPQYRQLVTRKMNKRIAEVETSRKYSLMIELSSVCNARCSFCPSATMNRKKGIMTDEVFDAVLRRVQSDRIKPPLIDLFDVGEPLLDRSLFARIQRLKSIFPESKIRITTNFAAATENTIVQILSSQLDSICISLKASNPLSYSRIMGLRFETTIRNVDRLIELKKAQGSPLHVLVSMVLCPENAGEEALFLRMWKGKVNSVRLQRAVDWGGKIGIRPAYHPDTSLYPCNDLFERIVVLSNGEVALCCQDAEGTIKRSACEQSLIDIFHSDKFSYYREKHLSGKIEELRMFRNCLGVHSNGANWVFQHCAA